MRQGFVPSVEEQAHGQSSAGPAGVGMHVLDPARERGPNVRGARCRGDPQQPPAIDPWHAHARPVAEPGLLTREWTGHASPVLPELAGAQRRPRKAAPPCSWEEPDIAGKAIED